MTARLYHQKLARVLDRMGSLYAVTDILERIADGRMQSFVVNNSWVVTQIVDFPRARQLQVIVYAGDLKDGEELHARVMSFADENNCALVSTLGRAGWLRQAKAHGWRVKARNYVYVKEM